MSRTSVAHCATCSTGFLCEYWSVHTPKMGELCDAMIRASMGELGRQLTWVLLRGDNLPPLVNSIVSKTHGGKEWNCS